MKRRDRRAPGILLASVLVAALAVLRAFWTLEGKSELECSHSDSPSHWSTNLTTCLA